MTQLRIITQVSDPLRFLYFLYCSILFHFSKKKLTETIILVSQSINGHDVQKDTGLEADVHGYYLLCPHYA